MPLIVRTTDVAAIAIQFYIPLCLCVMTFCQKSCLLRWNNTNVQRSIEVDLDLLIGVMTVGLLEMIVFLLFLVAY